MLPPPEMTGGAPPPPPPPPPDEPPPPDLSDVLFCAARWAARACSAACSRGERPGDLGLLGGDGRRELGVDAGERVGLGQCGLDALLHLRGERLLLLVRHVEGAQPVLHRRPVLGGAFGGVGGGGPLQLQVLLRGAEPLDQVDVLVGLDRQQRPLVERVVHVVDTDGGHGLGAAEGDVRLHGGLAELDLDGVQLGLRLGLRLDRRCLVGLGLADGAFRFFDLVLLRADLGVERGQRGGHLGIRGLERIDLAGLRCLLRPHLFPLALELLEAGTTLGVIARRGGRKPEQEGGDGGGAQDHAQATSRLSSCMARCSIHVVPRESVGAAGRSVQRAGQCGWRLAGLFSWQVCAGSTARTFRNETATYYNERGRSQGLSLRQRPVPEEALRIVDRRAADGQFPAGERAISAVGIRHRTSSSGRPPLSVAARPRIVGTAPRTARSSPMRTDDGPRHRGRCGSRAASFHRGRSRRPTTLRMPSRRAAAADLVSRRDRGCTPARHNASSA